MKKSINSGSLIASLLAGGLGLLSAQGGPFFTNQVEKAVDLNASLDALGNSTGGYNPQSRFAQVSNDLWFTTKSGGLYPAANAGGTVSKFSLVTRQVTQVAYLNNNAAWGSAPMSPLLVVDQTNGFFTTSYGGWDGVNASSNKGAIVQIDLPSGNLTALHIFTNTDGATSRSAPIKIGDDLWVMTAQGATSKYGTIVKYGLTTGNYTVVTNFDGPVIGGYPYATPVYYNNAWYFTTFIGGSTFGQSGTTLGAGAFDRLTFDAQGNPVITRLVDLPAGYTQSPCGAPLLVGTNSFYFLTVGTAPTSTTHSPGAIIRYDLNTGSWVDLFDFQTNNGALTGLQPGYNGFTEWQGELYFLTRLGGTNNTGTVDKFNIASNTVIKLADLDGQVGPLKLGSEVNGFDNDGLVVLETNRYFMYFNVYAGGANGPGYGTILRVYLPPPPIQTTIATTNSDNVTLSWTGGYPPFDVLTNSDLSVAPTNWTAAVSGINSTNNTTNWSATLPVPAGTTFYSIRGLAQ
jgi:uncharacterized repeat protein (TIGR03803 family)